MRILVVLNNADRYLTVWDAVADRGIDVHVAAPTEVAQRFTERAGLTVHRVETRYLRSGRETWRLYPGLRKIIRTVNPDLIHMTTEPWSIVALQTFSVRRPTVVHGAEILFRSGTRAEILIRSLLCRMNLPRLAGYVGWNARAVDTALVEGLPRWIPTLVAPAEVPDPRTFTESRSARTAFRTDMGWADDDVVAGFVGRYSPEKGLSWLLAAFGEIQNSALRLDCFGTGPDEALIGPARAHSRGVIHDHGLMDSESIPALMASLDLLVIPSIATDGCLEQFGRVAIEAMLAGTPIVSSDSGALPEVIGEAGVLVPEGDTGSLARALDELSLDGPRRRELANIGHDRASTHFAPVIIAERLSSFWEQVLRSSANSSSEGSSLSPPIAIPAAVPIASPRTRPVVAVLMASHNRIGTTLQCLESLRTQQTEGVEIEIFLVDDASTDGTAAAVSEHFPNVHLIGGGGALIGVVLVLVVVSARPLRARACAARDRAARRYTQRRPIHVVSGRHGLPAAARSVRGSRRTPDADHAAADHDARHASRTNTGRCDSGLCSQPW